MRDDSSVRTIVMTLGFLLVAAFFMFSEHRAHLFGFLPYLFLLACPLLHVFGHGGHGGHGGHAGHGTHDGSPPDGDRRGHAQREVLP